MHDHEHVWGIRHHVAGTAYVQQCVSPDCQATREARTPLDRAEAFHDEMTRRHAQACPCGPDDPCLTASTLHEFPPSTFTPGDEAVQDAIHAVARDLIDKVVVAARDTGDMWEWYPEIGEHDWERVTAHVEAILRDNVRVPRDEFDTAYSRLTQRAL